MECALPLDETVDISNGTRETPDLLLALISGLPFENVKFDRDTYLEGIEQYENSEGTAKYFINSFNDGELTFTWKEDEWDTTTFYTQPHYFNSFPYVEDHDDEMTIRDGEIAEFTIWAEMDERIEKQAEKLYEYLSSAQRMEAYEGSGVCGYRDGYYYQYQSYFDSDEQVELALLTIEKETE